MRTLRHQGRDLCSLIEAATRLGCSRNQVYRLAAEGLLPVYKLGRRTFYDVDGLLLEGPCGQSTASKRRSSFRKMLTESRAGR